MIHIRNCQTPTDGASSSYYKWSTWMHREALLAGRWTEVANNGDAAWASNYSASYSDLVLDPAEPFVVRRAAGGLFSTPPANSALTLVDPVNDANCFIANILAYSTTALYLDKRNFAKPHLAASGLVGRVHVYGQTSLLAIGAWTVLAAPGTAPDRFQVRFEVGTTNRPYFNSYPRGDYATTKLISLGFTWAFDGSERRTMLNADIDGENFMVWNYPKTTASGVPPYTTVWAGGRLTDTAVGDEYPLFITANANTSTWGVTTPPWDWCQSWPLMMLGRFGEQVTGYLENLKYFSNTDYTGSLFHVANWYIQRGFFARQYPRAWMGDVGSGGFPRGRFPWRSIHESWVDWMPTDDLGTTRAAPGKMMIANGGLEGCDLLVVPQLVFP